MPGSVGVQRKLSTSELYKEVGCTSLGTVHDDEQQPPLTVIQPGEQDPVLARLRTSPSEEALVALEEDRVARMVDRDRAWIRTFWLRSAMLVLGGGGVVWWVNTMRPQDWRDLYLQPAVFAALTFIAIWRGLPPLLVMPLLALLPVIAVLVAGGTLPYWFVKAPILGGLALGLAFATPWPSSQSD